VALPLVSYPRFAVKVQDDPKLPDDSGEIPKSQGRGWGSIPGSETSSLLDRKKLLGDQLPPMLWLRPVGLLSPPPKKEKKQKVYSNCNIVNL